MLGFVGSGVSSLHGQRVLARAEGNVCVRRSNVRMGMGLAERAKKDIGLVKDALQVEKWGKVAATAALVGALMLAPVDSALAAQGGGRVGGSNFRSAPSSSYSAPSGPTTYAPAYGGYGGFYGPSFFPPMFTPVIMVGGGFPFSLFVIGGIAYLLLSAASISGGQNEIKAFERSTVTTVKIGLLSSAKGLQRELSMLARAADTSTADGLHYVLSETALNLLRNPDYWQYASVNSQQTTEAENIFGQLAMGERMKIQEFTLSNVKGRASESARARSTEVDMSKAPSEYISVTMIVANSGALKLPKQINNASELSATLEILGGIDETNLQAVEILWSPQSSEDTLSKAELLNDNPELRNI